VHVEAIVYLIIDQLTAPGRLPLVWLLLVCMLAAPLDSVLGPEMHLLPATVAGPPWWATLMAWPSLFERSAS
jgi:hypothetical protein